MDMYQKLKIHVVHSQKIINYRNLYKIIRTSQKLQNHEIFLPHETSEIFNTKQMIKAADLIVAECTEMTPGIAIELAWADAFEKDVIVFVKENQEVSGYLKFFNFKIMSYNDEMEIVEYLKEKSVIRCIEK